MAAALIIPSIFTAVDQLSPTVAKMRGNIIGFANSAEAAFSRVDRTVRRLTPALGNAQKQLLSMVGTGAALAAGFQLGSFSFNSLVNYETAVDQFRVIVSDLNDADFSKFETKINDVARETKRSGTEVAQAFEQIASKNAKFADTADGLGQVSKAAITLSKAARMDLGVAAENLIGIMNQFSFKANQADRAINVLAAGQAIGAASITQTAEAFVNLGPTAAGANISIERSVALIQTLAKFSLYGADAGTALRGSIIKLQKAGLGYKSGQFDINDALNDTNKLLDKMKTAKQKDALITQIFGIHNITAGKILTANRQTFNEFTQAVSGTNEAYKGAVINSGNLRTTLDQLSNTWVNLLINSKGTSAGMNSISDAAKWLTRNLSDVVDVVVTSIKIFLGYKAVMLATRTAFLLWNVTLGISSVMTRAFSASLQGNTVALAARNTTLGAARALNFSWAASTGAATEATWSLNAALAANPVGFVVLGVIALTAAIGTLIYMDRQLNAEYEMRSALNITSSMTAEEQAVNKLAQRYVKLGMNIKDATMAAIRFEHNAINIEKIKLQAEISDLDKQIAGNTVNLGVYGGKVDLPGTGALRDKAVAKSQVLTGLSAQSLALTNLAISKTQQAPAEQTAKFTSRDEFSSSELNKLFTQSKDSVGASTVKSEMKITIENNSDNTAILSSGNSKLMSTQPKQKSTKILDK